MSILTTLKKLFIGVQNFLFSESAPPGVWGGGGEGLWVGLLGKMNKKEITYLIKLKHVVKQDILLPKASNSVFKRNKSLCEPLSPPAPKNVTYYLNGLFVRNCLS